LFHITYAIARFFQILLFDIARSVAGLVVLALPVLAASVVVLRRLVRRRRGK